MYVCIQYHNIHALTRNHTACTSQYNTALRLQLTSIKLSESIGSFNVQVHRFIQSMTEKHAASAVATVVVEELPLPGGGAFLAAAEKSSRWQLPGAADANVGWLATTLVVGQELVEALKN